MFRERRPFPVALRPAVIGDLEAVVAIEQMSFSDPPWSRASFGSLIDNRRACFTVALSPGDDRVIGYVVAWAVGDEAEVANLAVAPSWRARGVGAQLLDAALDEVAEHGARVAHLEVRETNAAAHSLYTSRGFQPVGRRRRYYRDPVEDAVLLRCDLRRRDGAASTADG
jgi:ribosomal-protein-alanine N-acetyltransferase